MPTKSSSQPSTEYLDNEFVNPDFIQRWNNRLKGVVPEMQKADEAAGLIENGAYLKNPTAKNVTQLIINPSGKVSFGPKQLLDGKYMYVVDAEGNLIIGTRARGTPAPFNGKAPHPTLIGGVNPKVQAAGIVEFRGGKIWKIDDASGHFQPFPEMLQAAENSFKLHFKPNSFAKDFKGFVHYNE